MASLRPALPTTGSPARTPGTVVTHRGTELHP